jgi:hypothetical protein
MSAVPCPSCQQPMNAAAIVCPHCGKRRADIQGGLAGKALSKEEVNALIAVHAPAEQPSEGLMQTLVLPHPTTHGTARVVELVCTIIALPLVIFGVLSVGLSRRRTRRKADETRGELVPVLAAGGLGGLGLWSALSFAGLSTHATMIVIGVGLAALITRGAVRSHASSKRDRDLHRLAKPEPAPKPRLSKPELPPARIVTPAPEPHDPSAPPPDKPSILK